MMLILKEFRYRLWCIPAAVVLIFAFDFLYGFDIALLEENIILLPILICFSVFRGQEAELLTVASTATANIRIIRFAAVVLLFCVPMAICCTLLPTATDRLMIVVLSLTFTVSSITFFFRTILNHNISAALLTAALLSFVHNTVTWKGNMRYFQIYGSMDILSDRIFRTGRIVTAVCCLLLLTVSWLILFFTERKRT
ncbi:MAG: hypothetical protein E7452_10865 [Ruminococcaceae bacterium]|nr:hypothetical protein [Oscillospiraceae bacterium]